MRLHWHSGSGSPEPMSFPPDGHRLAALSRGVERLLTGEPEHPVAAPARRFRPFSGQRGDVPVLPGVKIVGRPPCLFARAGVCRLAARHNLADVRLRSDGTLVVTAPSPGFAEVARFVAETLVPGGARLHVRPDGADIEALRADLAAGPSPVTALIDERRAEARREGN